MRTRKHTQTCRKKNASSSTQFLSAGTARLDKHRLTAEVANTKPAGCNSGELQALWQSDFSLPSALLFLILIKSMNCSTELGVNSNTRNTKAIQYLIRLCREKPKKKWLTAIVAGWSCVAPCQTAADQRAEWKGPTSHRANNIKGMFQVISHIKKQRTLLLHYQFHGF